MNKSIDREKWKIEDKPCCNFCGTVEEYDHMFSKCKFVSHFLNKINGILKNHGYDKQMVKIEYLILGYKITYEKYEPMNVLLSYIAYTIYKAYYLSESQ